MQLTSREFWTAIHGMVLGAGFLLAFTGGFAGLWVMRSTWLSREGAIQLVRPLACGACGVAILAWLAVILGTYVIYPWYRAKPPVDPKTMTTPQLAHYPKFLLLSDKQTEDWHEWGMEWKEHIGWFAPILATAVASVVMRYRHRIAEDPKVRKMLLFLFSAAFFCAAMAGLLGAFINKFAPTR